MKFGTEAIQWQFSKMVPYFSCEHFPTWTIEDMSVKMSKFYPPPVEEGGF